MIVRLLLLFALLLPAACATSSASATAEKRIAISFDDAPRTPGAFLTVDERGRRLIAGLAEADVAQAAFFVNPGALAEPHGAGGEARLAAYVAAGHVLANHSFSHPRLSTTPTDAYVADIDRAALWLEGRPGTRPWFRFPYLDEGRDDRAKRDAVRAALAERRLINGYVTVDASDWHLEALTIAAATAGERMDMAALRDLYVESHVQAADYYDRLAVAATGRSPAHMLLLHETDLAALFLPDLVAALRDAGWTIATADAAFADPIAAEAARVDVPSAQGTLIEALAWQRGLPAPRWYERNDTRVYDRLFAERVLARPAQR